MRPFANFKLFTVIARRVLQVAETRREWIGQKWIDGRSERLSDCHPIGNWAPSAHRTRCCGSAIDAEEDGGAEGGTVSVSEFRQVSGIIFR
jgi:hypothetical protein